MTKVIINADDLGISLSVNKEIEKAINDGIISSATIIVNGDAFDDAVRIALSYPQISFGIHLNLIEFKSLTFSKKFKSCGVVDANDVFIEKAIYKVKSFDKELKDAIYEEFREQIQKLLDNGIVPSHLDSHQHVHSYFPLMNIIIKLSKEFNIKKIRRPIPMSIGLIMHNRQFETVKIESDKKRTNNKKSFLIRGIKLIINVLKEKYWVYNVKKIATVADSFYAYRILYYNYSYLKNRTNSKVIELMCHPGHPAYETETKLLNKKELNNHMYYTMINYYDI